MAEILRVLDMNYPRYNAFIRLLPIHYGINDFKILARGYEPVFSKYHRSKTFINKFIIISLHRFPCPLW